MIKISTTKGWLTLIAATTILLACNKEDKKAEPSNPSTPSTPDYKALIKHEWRYVALTSTFPIDYDNDGDTETDLFANLQSCSQDDIIHFVSDTMFLEKEGGIRCNPSGSDTLGAPPYKLNYPELTLINQKWTIAVLDEHKLEFYAAVQTQAGENRVTYTLIR